MTGRTAGALALLCCGALVVAVGATMVPRSEVAEPVAVVADSVTMRVGTAGTEIDGLGPATLAAIPPDAQQVVVAAGDGPDENSGSLARWERGDGGWFRVEAPVPARNGERGWTTDHREGDLRTPIGVFGLSAAGGADPNPGVALPYDHDPGFYVASGRSVDGTASLVGVFDHVVAVDYNRVPSTAPSDGTRPLGREAGGDIWIHLDHGAGTRGCIGIDRTAIVDLLRWLDPARSPVVVMGDRLSLAR